MAVGVQKAWSTTAATNASADSNVAYNEGQLAPTLNNSARAAMAAIKAWANQIQGGCTYGGSANAYTITSDATGAISTAYANGMMFMLKANHTNNGAATLNVDGVGAVAIRTSDGGAVQSGDIVSGGLYLLAYESATPSFMIVNTIGGGAYQPLDATLTAIAALDFSVAGSMMYSTAADTFSLLTSTANGRSILSAANYAAMRGLLDLEAGTDFLAYSAFSANGISLVGAANYAAMRTLLDLEAGTDFYSVSATDTLLNAKASLTGATFTGNVGVSKSSGLPEIVVTRSGTLGTDYPTVRLEQANRYDDIRNTPSGLSFRVNTTGTPKEMLFTSDGGLQARVATSSETSGSLTGSASGNKHIAMTGDITLANSTFTAGDKMTLDPGTSARTITRGSGVTMYVNGSDSATATLAANQMGGVHWRSASVCVLSGAVS